METLKHGYSTQACLGGECELGEEPGGVAFRYCRGDLASQGEKLLSRQLQEAEGLGSAPLPTQKRGLTFEKWSPHLFPVQNEGNVCPGRARAELCWGKGEVGSLGSSVAESSYLLQILKPASAHSPPQVRSRGKSLSPRRRQASPPRRLGRRDKS